MRVRTPRIIYYSDINKGGADRGRYRHRRGRPDRRGRPAARFLAGPRGGTAAPGRRAASGRAAPALLRDDQAGRVTRAVHGTALGAVTGFSGACGSARPFLAWPWPAGRPPTKPP